MDLRKRTHKLFSTLVVLVLCLVSAPPHRGYAQTGSSYTFGDCGKVEQATLRAAIQERAEEALSAEQGYDIGAVVQQQWRALNVDAALDAEIERAINNMYENEGYLSRLWSGWSADKAEEFAQQITSDAFGSDAFRLKIEELSNAVASELVADIEARLATASEDAIHCMKDFVGTQYSATLFQAFETEVTRDVDDVEYSSNASDGVTVSPIDTHGKLLTGVGVILATQITRRVATKLATKITQRIAGKIVTRVVGRVGSSFIPVVGWVVGAVLIAWDLWEGGNGALPQIQESLQSEEVKERIRTEITDSIYAGLPDEISAAALEIAATLMDEWHGFCRSNLFTCTLAEENPRFRRILNETPIDQVAELSAMTDLFMNNLGRTELDAALEDGYFERLAVAPDILLATRSAETTLRWIELAGDALPQLLALELYRFSTLSLESLDRATLDKLLALEEQATVTKLLDLDPAESTTLLALPMPQRKQIIDGYSLADLKWLVTYLTTAATEAGTEAGAEATVSPAEQEATIAALANGSISVSELRADWEQKQATSPTEESSLVDQWLGQWRWSWLLITALALVALFLTIVPRLRGTPQSVAAQASPPKPRTKPNLRQYELQKSNETKQYKLEE